MTWKRALVTGASSGIGAHFAEQLAARGADLVLVARSEDELAARAEDFAQRFGVQAEVLPADLTDRGDLEAVAARLRDDAAPVDLLVSNAGIGSVGPVAGLPLAREEEIVRLNTLAMLHLLRTAAAVMRARRAGTIISMASLAAYQPVPYFGVYAATKAFVLSLTLTLREELRGSGVTVTAICPGFVATEFGDKAGVVDPPLRRLYTAPERVAAAGLRGAEHGRAVVFVGPVNQAAAFLSRLSPPSVFARVIAAAGRRLAGGTIDDAAVNNRAYPAGPPRDELGTPGHDLSAPADA